MELDILKKLLNISAPWILKDIKVQTATKVIDVHIGFERGSLFACPSCGTLSKVHDSSVKRIRHLDMCDFRLYLNIKKPRVNCWQCGIQTTHSDIWSRNTLQLQI